MVTQADLVMPSHSSTHNPLRKTHTNLTLSFLIRVHVLGHRHHLPVDDVFALDAGTTVWEGLVPVTDGVPTEVAFRLQLVSVHHRASVATGMAHFVTIYIYRLCGRK